MDPFSIVVGAVALTEAANKLASTLTDRYKAFNSAPKQMIEIAGQITLCAGLVDVFAKSVDGTGGGQFPRKFEQDAAALVKQCRTILKEIDEMIPSGSKKPDYQQRLKYAFRDEKKIVKHQDRLKQVQHMFMFMTTCWMYQLPSLPTSHTHASQTPRQPVGLSSSGGSAGFSTSQSAMSQPPMQFNLKGFGGMNGNQNYEATLTLTPIRQSGGISRPVMEQEYSRTAQKPTKTGISSTQKENLENMRRSPYFSLDMLKQPVVEPKMYMRESAQRISLKQEEKIKMEEERRRMEEERKRMQELFEAEARAKEQAEVMRVLERKMAEELYNQKQAQGSSPTQEERSRMEEERRKLEKLVEMEVKSKEKAEEERRAWERKIEGERRRMMETVAMAQKKEKGEERREFEPISKQQAEKDVTSIISEWFSDNSSDDDTYRPRSNYNQSPDSNIKPLTPIIQESYLTTSSYPPSSTSQTSLYTPTLVGSTYPGYPDRISTNSTKSPPPTSPTPPPLVRVVEDWDWRCDGCDKKFYYHDLRFKCQDCSDFDFCPQCFPNVWHRHPTSSFVERSV